MNQIGNISLSDDAEGTWQSVMTFAFSPPVYVAGHIDDGQILVGGLAGDLDGDAFVGIGDLSIVLGEWNNGQPPTTIIQPNTTNHP